MKKIIMILFLSFSVVSAKANSENAISAYTAPKYDSSYDLPEVNIKQLTEQIKKSETLRNPAAEESANPDNIKNLKDLVSKVHSLKTSEDVDGLFKNLEDNYTTSSDEVKFYAATIAPLKPFRGFVYRLIPLLKNHSKFVHSQLLSRFKRLVGAANVFLPYEHIDAFIEYVSSPYYYEDKNGQTRLIEPFNNERDLQRFVHKYVLPSLRDSTVKLSNLKITNQIMFDQKIIFGPDSFKEQLNRIKWVGEFEKSVILTQMYLATASFSTFISYNVDSAIDLYKDVGYLYGFDGFKNIVNLNAIAGVDGVTAADILPVIRSNKYKMLGTKLPNANDWMKHAHSAIQNAVKIADTALSNVSDERIKNQDYIASQLLTDLNRRDPRNGLKLLRRIVESDTEESLRSVVNGDIITINFKNLFYKPPTDFKDFLPTLDGIDKQKKVSRKVTKGPGAGQTLTYRNYKEGMIKKFNHNAYVDYFPSVKSSDDVFKTARVLSHQGGSWLVLAQ